MSGFVLVIDLDGAPVDAALLERLSARLAYLGPDGLGIRTAGPVGMGHALYRTSAEAPPEHQPSSLDGDTWILANARIDDRANLIGRLGSRESLPLASTPDSELILRAYERWGEACPAHLLGDFAFAIWDGRARSLLCARDRFGLRQLYYARVGRSLAVSNSLWCLLGHPGISSRLDELAMAGFLVMGDHTWLDKDITAFADIRVLPPAHCLLLRHGEITTRRYWDFPIEVPLLHHRGVGEVVEQFREVFAWAVSDRLRADSVVISLSGGMDSSSMAAMARHLGVGSAGAPALHAVTVVYDRVHPSEERRYAAQVARHLDIPIHFIEADRYPLLSPPIATARPLELYNPALWLDWLKAAGARGRVYLHGEGGDSLFRYSSGRATRAGVGPLELVRAMLGIRQRYGTWPALGTGLIARWRRLTGSAAESGSERVPFPDWIEPGLAARLGLKERWDAFWTWHPVPRNVRHPLVHEALVGPEWNLEETYLHPGVAQPDHCDPFLDLRLIELVLSLPALPWLFRKHLLREAMAGWLPDEVLRRPKTALGEIHESLLAQPEARWIETWRPRPEIHRYLDVGRLGPYRADGDNYLALRPVLLDRWVGAIDEALKSG